MIIAIILGLSCALSAADKPTNPQKIQLSDEVLDRLAEVERVYQSFLGQGMIPARAAAAALKWQEERYPIIMYPLKEEDYKDELDKGGKKEHKSKKDDK